MVSLGSDDDASEHSVKTDDEMDDEDIIDYYRDTDDHAEVEQKKDRDPEYFEYELLKVEDVERLLNENVEALSEQIQVHSLSV